MSVTTSQVVNNVSALNKIIADVKYRIGIFLANEKIIYDVQTRAEALLNSGVDSVINASKIILAKCSSLLKIQKDVESSAQTFLLAASDLKTKIETSPLYSFLKTPIYHWGTRQYDLAASFIGESGSMAIKAAALGDRMLRQNSDVKILRKEVESLEGAAQGKGVVPKIQGILSGTVGQVATDLSKVVRPLAWALGSGIAIYLLIAFRPRK